VQHGMRRRRGKRDKKQDKRFPTDDADGMDGRFPPS
jgi:hypothetical protein